jgi:hypothetical protein
VCIIHSPLNTAKVEAYNCLILCRYHSTVLPPLPNSMYKQRRSKACNKACMNVCLTVARAGAELLQRPPVHVVVVGSECLAVRPLGAAAVDGSVEII